jgi:hypothetical protein
MRTGKGVAPDARAVDLAGRIQVAVAATAALAGEIAAVDPLPATARIGHDEDAWGPREVLAHACEAVPYWHGELERILAADPASGPSPFGRTATDPAREGIIGRDRTLPAFFLVDRLGRDASALTARVRRLTPADLERVGRHPAWGEITVASMLERTLAAHLEGHVAQLRALVAG